MAHSRPDLQFHDIGPVPFYAPADAAPVAPPPSADPLDDLAARLDHLHHRAVAAARDDRMHPLGVRDIQHFAELLVTLRRLAADSTSPTPPLADPPATRALALPDLLPYLAPARRLCDQLRATRDRRQKPLLADSR